MFNGDDIVTLTSASWEDTVANDEDNVWVVSFYADWCPYCKTFSDEYDLAAADPALANKKIKFGAVDVMANRDLTKKYEIKRSPTVKIFGTDKATPEDFTGQRKASDLVSFCDGYCEDNEFVEEEVAAKFDYNIDSIVGTISGAHK